MSTARSWAAALGLLIAGAGSCQIISGGDEFSFGGGSPVGAGGVGGGGGSRPECVDDADCPGTDATCLPRQCEMGICLLAPAPQGTACTEDQGQVCDGLGHCLDCNDNDDCVAGVEQCDANKCVPQDCLDGAMNGEETAVDCGGSVCAPCELGETCGEGTDCASGFCDATQSCAACGAPEDCPADRYCDDGTCAARKELGDVCDEAIECASGNCVDEVCCNIPCTGTCKACTNAKTSGPTGECHPVPQGEDPDDECDLPTPAIGTCNGDNACGI